MNSSLFALLIVLSLVIGVAMGLAVIPPPPPQECKEELPVINAHCLSVTGYAGWEIIMPTGTKEALIRCITREEATTPGINN